MELVSYGSFAKTDYLKLPYKKWILWFLNLNCQMKVPCESPTNLEDKNRHNTHRFYVFKRSIAKFKKSEQVLGDGVWTLNAGL